MPIQSVSTSQPTSLGSLSNGFSVSELSPDALLAYCAGQLNGMDGQIKEFMKLAKGREAARGALNDLKGTLNAHKGGLDADDPARLEIVKKYDAAIEAVKQTDPNLASHLTSEKNDFIKTAINYDGTAAPKKSGDAFNDEILDKSRNARNGTNDKEIDRFLSRVTDIVGDLDQSSQLDMMTLQSIMSKRQTAVQMCTNMVNTLGDTSKSIAANIGK